MHAASVQLLAEAASAMLASPDPHARFSVLSAALGQLGIDQINYGFLDPAAAERAKASVTFLSTMQADWLSYYYDRDLHLTDPHVAFVRANNLLPYRWSDASCAFLEDQSQRHTALETSEAGIRSALCVPLAAPHSPGVAVAGMTLGSTLPESELSRVVAGMEPQLVALVHLYHNSTIGAVTRAQLGMGELSARERDTLTLLARGMRQGQIADRLGISLSAVEQYLANARRKLKAANLAEAVAKGILHQAISL